jgi:hypothetical protein
MAMGRPARSPQATEAERDSAQQFVRLVRSKAYPPRGLRREDAAAYIGVGTTKFDEMVRNGRMPAPKRVDGCVIWDRYRLDEAFEALPDDGEPADGWDKVA